MNQAGTDPLAQLDKFDDIIDVRSPSEYAEDHIPGAANFPVLDDEQRKHVGTLYKHSPFEARKIGAVLVSRNIARHLEQHWPDKPKSWHPLVYCWRGGQRSGSMTYILRQIGFAAERLEGGYKSYRHHVLQHLHSLPAIFSYRVICGMTGSGKSLLLAALHQAGGQVLDLENLANHRGSVLGELPHARQPAQKGFDSLILARLKSFDPGRPVYVESESRKIGLLQVPEALIEAMRASPCLHLDCDTNTRVALLLAEYAHFLDAPELLMRQLERLRGLHSGERLSRWYALCEARAWETLVAELLEQHYDPAYLKSIHGHYAGYDRACPLSLNTLDKGQFQRLAREVLALQEDFVNNG